MVTNVEKRIRDDLHVNSLEGYPDHKGWFAVLRGVMDPIELRVIQNVSRQVAGRLREMIRQPRGPASSAGSSSNEN